MTRSAYVAPVIPVIYTWTLIRRFSQEYSPMFHDQNRNIHSIFSDYEEKKYCWGKDLILDQAEESKGMSFHQPSPPKFKVWIVFKI